MKKKLIGVFVLVLLFLIYLNGTLAQIVFAKGKEYSQTVITQQNYDSIDIPFRRGDIVDRNGTVLATSERAYHLVIDIKVILSKPERYEQATKQALIEYFEFSQEELDHLFQEKSNSSYERPERTRKISHEIKEGFDDFVKEKNKEYQKNAENGLQQIHGLWFETIYQRQYPNNDLASQLIGFSNKEGKEAIWGGLEQQYDSALIGLNGREYGFLNQDGLVERITKPPENGHTLVSTIDVNIQKILEKHVKKFASSPGANRVSAIAMNPKNGEILGMTSDLTYDLNDPFNLRPMVNEQIEATLTEEEKTELRYQMWKNFCISDAYEPGSTVKIFTIAAALEEGILSLDDEFICDGFEQIGSWKIKCVNIHGHGKLNLVQSLAYSCNDALMQIGARIGSDTFLRYLKNFGFGDYTQIDLSGESKGVFHSAQEMNPVDLATNSFGQNYTVSMIQLISAYASIINGGSYYEPHVVKKILDTDGSIIQNIEPNLVKETISHSTAEFIKSALFQTVEKGTGSHAHIDGYQIAGKTGTAEKLPRADKNYLMSFCGFVPYDNPQILLYVIVDQPHIEPQANSAYATDIFHAIMEELLPYVNIFPNPAFMPPTEAPPETAPETLITDGVEVVGENPTGTALEESVSETEVIQIQEEKMNLPDSVPLESNDLAEP
ncbi:stage V sporulation protein D [Clostridia bacterium]|nr:stage V sporulation protein D [Clostridia bacterium]